MSRRRVKIRLEKGGVTIGESNSGTIGHIKLGRKRIGKRSAGNPHAAFEEAGAGNGLPRQPSTLHENGCSCKWC